MKNVVRSVPKIKGKSLFSWFIVVGFLCLLSINLVAETSSSDQEDEKLIKQKRKLPLLNGHIFISSTNLYQTPFVTTFFRNSTGFGRTLGYEIPIYGPGGELLTNVKANLTYMMLEFTYQQAVNDWLAFWINGLGVGRMGINAESILSKGVSALGGFELGGLVRIWDNDKAILSAAASYRHNKLIGVDIIGFAQSIIDSGIIDMEKLLNRIPSYRWKGGLRFAYAFNDLAGFILYTDLGRGDSLEGNEDRETVFDIGGLVSLDLNTRTKLPIGFAFGYHRTTYPEASGDFVENMGVTSFRIAYTGRREFSIGLETTYSNASLVNTDKTLNFGSIFINLQYYF